MAYVPLRIPPGVYRNGTKYQSMGRWFSADLVRWQEGAMQPVGGWEKWTYTGDAINAPPRGMLGWRSNALAAYLAVGTATKAFGFSGGVMTDITPAAGFTTGLESAALTSGAYDTGAYDVGPYGTGDESLSTLTEAQTWQFDNFGQVLMALAYSDGDIMSWDLNPSNNLVVVTNAPTTCKGLVVTPERFVVALASGGNGRQVQWSDQEDETVWTPASTNQAGDFILPGTGSLQCGSRMRGETLLWTDVDLFSMRYIGGTLVYQFIPVGANCGIIGRLAKAVADNRAFWMSQRGFFLYDGTVRPIPCSISDAVFNDLNEVQRSKIAAIPVSQFHEIWFAYPSSASSENDKIAVYNYAENYWTGPWSLERTSGIDSPTFGYPVMGDASDNLYFHERGISYLAPNQSTVLTPSAESGPIEIAGGDRVMTVRRFIPDENTLGDVDATIYASFYPTATEASQALTIAAPTDVRLTGRQVRLRIVQDQPGWRVGVPRLEVVPRGLR